MLLASLFDIPGDADTRRRGRTMLTITLLLFGLNLLRPPLALLVGTGFAETLPATLLGVVGLGLPIFIVRRGRVLTAGWLLIVMGLAVVSTMPLMRRELILPLVFLSMPVLFAALTMRPAHVWPALALALAALAICASVAGERSEWPAGAGQLLLVTATLLVMVGVLGFIGARATARAFAAAAAARGDAEASSRELEDLNRSLAARVAEQTADLRAALADIQRRSAEQQQLLDELAQQRETIREMSVPVLPVDRATLVLPLIGALDSARIQQLQRQALGAIEHLRARRILLDVTGVPVIDTQVAQGLIQTVQAARLLGASAVLIGVRPEVAQALVALGADLSAVSTAANLESALHQ